MAGDDFAVRSDGAWCDTEMFYYGRIVSVGGVQDSKIKMDTRQGRLSISVEEDVLRDMQYPPCHECGVQVTVRQNVRTGEVDLTHDLRLVRLIEYKPGFDEEYLSRIQDRAAKSWDGVDVDKYINDICGTYD